MTSGSNVTNACIHSEACMMDLTWALVRMPPLKLFGVDIFLSKKQRVPGWCGFNAVVLSCVPVLTNIGYCPMNDGSPTEFWPRSAIVQCTFFLNVYTVLNSIGEPSISKKKWTSVVAWVVLLPSMVSSYCHYCQLQPVQTHKWKYLMVILPQLYHCWQWSHLQC